MDITNENFLQRLPEITENIRSCDFIAIDTELSGLTRDRGNNRFDLPGERFTKLVESSRGYFIMQFGLSCFTRSEHDLHYSNKTYNFYIFPQANQEHGDINRTFSLQVHAIQFLSEHKFDFNKLFKHGVSYLTFHESRSLSSKLKSTVIADTQEDKLDIINNKLAIAKGFLGVLDVVIAHKKPIVGHNLILDLIQIINQFIEPLSDDYTAFKETCHSLFPLIYDTKFIAHLILDPDTLTNNQSRLNDLYCQLKASTYMPKITVQQLDQNLDANQQAHQAGYDAYMSGYCFIAMSESYIQTSHKQKCIKEAPDSRPVSITQEHRISTSFANKIHLSYSYDFKYFNLSGDEEEPDRSHVFYIVYPPSWGLQDIFHVFSTCGGVVVSFLTEKTALCALRNKRQKDDAMKMVQKLKSMKTEYRIYTYAEYLNNGTKFNKSPGDA